MIVWRLSGVQFARSFDGGYGLFYSGRWNSKSTRITYCATSPALCTLEKLVHIEDPTLLPPLVMVSYEIPENLVRTKTELSALPANWPRDARHTQQRGDLWIKSQTSSVMLVPSAVLPVKDSPDLNVLINHAHPDSGKITIRTMEDFVFDARLL